jgi:hypothetical protein
MSEHIQLRNVSVVRLLERPNVPESKTGGVRLHLVPVRKEGRMGDSDVSLEQSRCPRSMVI